MQVLVGGGTLPSLPTRSLSHPSAHAVRFLQLVTIKCSGLNQVIGASLGSPAAGMLEMMTAPAGQNLARRRDAIGVCQPQQAVRNASRQAGTFHRMPPPPLMPER